MDLVVWNKRGLDWIGLVALAQLSTASFKYLSYSAYVLCL